MNELTYIDKKIKKEVELENYQGKDRIVLAEEKKAEILLERANRPPFMAKTGIPGLDECVDGFRKGQLVIVSGPPKHGKCLKKGTEILMFSGKIKKIEKIKAGELVMGPDSKPRTVLSLGNGIEEMFKIKQGNESYVVNKSHILSLQRNNGHLWRTDNLKKEKRPRKKYAGKIVNISVEDYLSTSTTFKHHHKGYKVGIDFLPSPVEIDPYFLGLWLGDGDSAGVAITNMEPETESYLRGYAGALNLKLKISKNGITKAFRYFISRGNMIGGSQTFSLQGLLRKIKVLNNKHIPENYKINSREVRLKVLAGIIDTDGYLTKNKWPWYDIILKSDTLAKDIVFLARSLGFGVTIKKCKKGIKKTGFIGLYNRIRISGELSSIPVLVNRKKSGYKTKKNILTHAIKVKSVGIGEYYGFELDKDGLFVLGNFIVTHNTALCQTFTKRFTAQGLRCLWFSYELGYEELFEKFPMDVLDFYVPNYLESGNLEWVENRIIESKQKFKTEVVFIDHLDFLRDPDILKGVSINLAAYIGGIIQKIKRTAIEQNVLIFLMTHIRKNEWKTDDLPSSEELRDSGQIAQLADIVMMITRARTKKGSEEVYFQNCARVGVIENRHNGKTRKIKVVLKNGEFSEEDWQHEGGNENNSIRNQGGWNQGENYSI